MKTVFTPREMHCYTMKSCYNFLPEIIGSGRQRLSRQAKEKIKR